MPGERHEILTVHDFAHVPAERRALCLREFLVWLDLVEATRRMFRGVAVKPPEAFVWIDDDLHKADISVVSPDGTKIPVASGVMKGFGE